METEAQVDAHNAKVMWADTAEHLLAASHELRLAQGVLDDLGASALGVQLVPLVTAIEGYRRQAEAQVSA